MIEFKTPYTFDKVIRILIGIAIIVAVILLFRRLSAVLTPFLIAWLIAYLLHPIVKFFQYKLKFKSRILSIFTTLTLFIASLIGIILLIVPLIAKEVKNFSILIQNYTENYDIYSIIPLSWRENIADFFQNINLQDFIQGLNISELFKQITPRILGIVDTSFSIILSLMVLIIIFLYLIFILKDYEKINQGLPSIIPPNYRNLVMEILGDIEDGMNKYFRGQALIALIVGALFTIGFLIIGLPMAVVFGLFVGVLNLVPYLQAISIVPATFLIILKAAEPGSSFWGVLVGVFIVYLVVQIIQDAILVPTIMGKVTGMKPAIILLSLSIWGSLMGIIGLIIALPLTTLIISYYKRWVIRVKE